MVLDEVAPFHNHKLGFTVYYLSGATGFTQPWYTYLTAVETIPRTSAVWNRTTALSGLNSSMKTLEPTLIPPEKGTLLIGDNTTTAWKMWFQDNHNLYYAESLDGIAWTKCLQPVISDHACPFVVKNASTYYLYAVNSAYTQLDLYTSSNGRDFTPYVGNPVISRGIAGSWNDTALGNTGGIVFDGTFYMFLEGADNTSKWSDGLFTSTNFSTFTPYAENPVIASSGGFGGVTVPYRIGATWWLWIHGASTGILPTDIYRYSAPVLTGPWTQSPVGATLPRTTQDEGVGSSVGQVADPFIIEVGGKTYLYYSAGNDGAWTNADATSIIKVAIANIPLSQLVQTDEYDYGLSYLLFIKSKTPWPKQFTTGRPPSR